MWRFRNNWNENILDELNWLQISCKNWMIWIYQHINTNAHMQDRNKMAIMISWMTISNAFFFMIFFFFNLIQISQTFVPGGEIDNKPLD